MTVDTVRMVFKDVTRAALVPPKKFVANWETFS